MIMADWSSVGDKYMAVALPTSAGPTGTKKSTKANEQVAVANSSDVTRHRVSVDVFAGYFAPVRAKHNQGKSHLRDASLKWIFNGQYVVANRRFTDVVATLNKIGDEAKDIFAECVRTLPQRAQEDARSGRLGDLYDASLYPTEQEFWAKYRYDVVSQPLSGFSEDPILGWSEEHRKIVEEQKQKQLDSAIREANREIIERVTKPVKNVVDQLSVYNGGRRGSFTAATFIKNVRDMVGIIDDYNFDDNAELNEIKKAIVLLGNHDPQTLRESKGHRNAAVASANDILDRVGNFGANL
jgi:hypothetical protein